jgi:hypothetical protein
VSGKCPGRSLDVGKWKYLMPFLAKHVGDHLDHGQLIIHQKDLGHPVEAKSKLHK